MNNGEPLSFASHFGVPVELGMVQSVVLESDSCVYMYKLCSTTTFVTYLWMLIP